MNPFLGRKKKEDQKNTNFVYLKNRKSSLKQKKKNNKNLKPKEDPKKNLITLLKLFTKAYLLT